MVHKLINKIPRFINNDDLLAIEEICNKLPSTATIVEIGTFMGASAIAWAHYGGIDKHIYTIDSLNMEKFKDTFELSSIYEAGFVDSDLFPQETNIQKNIKNFDNISFINARSPDIIWNESIDLLFIDAVHSNEKLLMENITFWDKFLKPGGYMVFHDYEDEWPIVKKIVDSTALMYDSDIELFSYSMAVLRK